MVRQCCRKRIAAVSPAAIDTVRRGRKISTNREFRNKE
jgi:hypothetical protein